MGAKEGRDGGEGKDKKLHIFSSYIFYGWIEGSKGGQERGGAGYAPFFKIILDSILIASFFQNWAITLLWVLMIKNKNCILHIIHDNIMNNTTHDYTENII